MQRFRWMFLLALLAGSLGVAAAGPVAAPGYPQPFAAEFTRTIPGGLKLTESVKIFATPEAVRLEREGVVVIYRAGANRTYILSPEQRQYMEFPGVAGEAAPYLPVGKNPCARYGGNQACRRLGAERVAGRAAVKWQVGAGSAARLVWVDPELRLVVRERMVGVDLILLRRLQPGPQPSTLFQLPSGYRRIG